MEYPRVEKLVQGKSEPLGRTLTQTSRMPRKNQYKPCRQYLLIFIAYSIDKHFLLAPDKDIRKLFEEYFSLGCSDVQIMELLKFHYNMETYGMR